MNKFSKGTLVYETQHPDNGTAEVLYQCGSGGIQSPGAEPEGHDVTVVRWGSDNGIERLPSDTLSPPDR
jgi:hypothetical protein